MREASTIQLHGGGIGLKLRSIGNPGRLPVPGFPKKASCMAAALVEILAALSMLGQRTAARVLAARQASSSRSR